MKFSEQQKKAIEVKNTSLIVSAAAGSGKTSVLTERIVNLIMDENSGVSADRIIAVTFTNDSAGELKKRINSSLMEQIANDPSNVYLRKQQILLQKARISTINSFCFDFLRDNISDERITSGFSICDEIKEKTIKSQAMEELLNYYSKEEYDKISFLYDKFCIKNIDGIKEIVNCADKFLASVSFREKWLEKAVNEYRKPFEESVYFRRQIEIISQSLEKALDNIEYCIEILPDALLDISSGCGEKAYVQLLNDRTAIKKLIDVLKKGNISDFELLCSKTNFGNKETVKGDFISDKFLSDSYAKKRKSAVDSVKKICSMDISSMKKEYEEAREVTEVFIEVIRKFEEIVWDIKCEKNVLSFDDGERLTLEMLADYDEKGFLKQSKTAKEISEFYSVIMIDEYQDSNNKQDLIFKLISKNFRTDENGNAVYGDNVFLVGDVKQSIYGFRLANPENFKQAMRLSQPYEENSSSKNQYLFLSENFRSSEPVINFVNSLFSSIMSVECGGIDYNENEKLYFSSELYKNCSLNMKTHINFINDDIDENDKNPPENIEAVFTARKIAEMLKNGAEVIEKDGSSRPCRPSDFCILLRKNKPIPLYVNELMKLNVFARGKEQSGYLKSREITILINLLRIIANPLLDIPMVSVMTSPMYMFTIEEIAEIKALEEHRNKGLKRSEREKYNMFPIIKGICEDRYEEMKNSVIIEKCRHFLASLDSYRLDSVTMKTSELIGAIYDDTDFISVMQLYSDGERKRANLRALISHAQKFEDVSAYEGAGGLDGFLRYIDKVLEKDDYEQSKISSVSGDYVTVQTIHGSKGLQYKFVFIAETTKVFKSGKASNGSKSRSNADDPALFEDNGCVGYVLYDSQLIRKYRDFQYSMIKKQKEKLEKNEYMRLLYVALTRAEQQIFINMRYSLLKNARSQSSVKRINSIVENFMENNSTAEIVSDSKSFSDWFWTLIIRNPKFTEIAEKIGLNTDNAEFLSFDDEDILDYEIFNYYEDKNNQSEEQTTDKKCIQPDMKLAEEIMKIINTDYDYELSELPAKLSVTQLSHKAESEKEFDYTLQRPRFITSSSKLTGAERGTAIHTFFQYCDFDEAENHTSDEIFRIESLGYINHEEAKSIDIPNVKAFFETPLYTRIKESREVWRERKFTVAVSELNYSNPDVDKFKKTDGMVKGIIDLMFEEKDGIVIVDYKSDRGVSARKLKERYKMQLQLYKSAVELITGKKVKETLLYSFELHETVRTDL